jgi:hypothetical protein
VSRLVRAMLIRFLDVAAVIVTFVAAFLWYRASAKLLRRIARHEVLDSADINRLVVSFNRTQTLNARAALATAISAAIVAVRMALSL